MYGVSDSDNTRTICAYLIGLLESAQTLQTNQPGLLILDEASQQNMVWSHFTKVLERAADAIAARQIVIATSDSIEGIEEINSQTECHSSLVEGKTLKRLPFLPSVTNEHY